jgi:hypothetical protein
MGDGATLEQLLALEDDPALVELVCPTTGVLAWPAIRLEVFRLLVGDRVFGTAQLVDFAHRPDLRRIAGGAVRAAVHNRRHPPRRSDVLLVATGAGLTPRDGRSFNRYVDYFAAALGDQSWTVESLFHDVWPPLPRANRRIGLIADHRLGLTIRGRTSVRAVHRDLARDLIDIAARRGRDVLGWEIGDDRRTALIAIATRRLATYPVQARFVDRLIRRIQPRVLIVEEGCYGHMAVLNATAREAGVPVAEFQHGMVTRGHDAYNVAPQLAGSEAYRRTQPAAFLGYGRWWNDQFNAPVDEKVVVGNPHRTETLRTWRPDSARTQVVVLGDGVETEAYLALCRRLMSIVAPPLRVVFRPHPLERPRVAGGGDRSVAIDNTPDLYASLAAARAVVAEASTALFEAVGLVPGIFVWDTDKSRFYLGDHPFQRFADPTELAGLLATGDPDRLRPDVTDAIWAEDWQGRFLRYVTNQARATSVRDERP